MFTGNIRGISQNIFVKFYTENLEEFLRKFYERLPGIAFRTKNVHSATHFHIKTAQTCTHTEEHCIPWRLLNETPEEILLESLVDFKWNLWRNFYGITEENSERIPL